VVTSTVDNSTDDEADEDKVSVEYERVFVETVSV